LRREVDASSTSPAAPIYETLAGGSLHIAISVPAQTLDLKMVRMKDFLPTGQPVRMLCMS